MPTRPRAARGLLGSLAPYGGHAWAPASYSSGLIASSPRVGRAGLVAIGAMLNTAHFTTLLVWDVPEHAGGVGAWAERRRGSYPDSWPWAYPHGVAAWHTVALIVACTMLLSVGGAFWEAQLPAIVQTFFGRDADRYAALSGASSVACAAGRMSSRHLPKHGACLRWHGSSFCHS